MVEVDEVVSIVAVVTIELLVGLLVHVAEVVLIVGFTSAIVVVIAEDINMLV